MLQPANDIETGARVAGSGSTATQRAQAALERFISPGFPTKVLAMLVASVWVIIAATPLPATLTGSPDGKAAYAVAVGAVGLFFTLLIIGMLMLDSHNLDRQLLTVKQHPVSLQQALAAFLSVWWAAGAGVTTFLGPFTDTNNGYFGMWAGFAASMLALADCFEAVQDRVQGVRSAAANSVADESSLRSQSILLGVAALVVMLASIEPLDNQGEAVFSFVSAILTMVICLVLVFANIDQSQQTLAKVISVVLFALWLVTAGVCTFRGPFETTGNGFFGVYAGAFFSFKLFAIYFIEGGSVNKAAAGAA